MPRKIDREDRRAERLNPSKAGVRTGNPQLEAHGEGEVRSRPRQRTPRRRAARRVKAGPTAAPERVRIDKPESGPLNGPRCGRAFRGL